MTTSRRMATRSQSLDSPATSASRIDSTRSGERPTINDGFYTLLFIRVHAEFDAVPVRSSSALARNFAPAEKGSWGFLGPPIRSKFAREWKGKRKKKERKKRKNSRQRGTDERKFEARSVCKETRDAAICNRVTQLW